MHTLISDGRKYIGITCQKPEKRWRNGKGYKHSACFWNAIQKYNWDNFRHEILFENLTKEQACNKEKALIKLFNTMDHNYGFNLTQGGEHYEITEEVRKKISIHTKKAMQNINLAKTTISYNELYTQYIVLNKTQKECCQYFNCTQGSFTGYLKKYNIKKDPIVAKNNRLNAVRPFISKEELSYQLLVLNKSITECTKYFNTSANTIRKLIKEYDIDWAYQPWTKFKISKEELEYQYVTLNKTMQQCADYFGCTENTICHYCQKYNLTKPKLVILKEELFYQHYMLHKTIKECAEYFNCSERTIFNKLKKFA